LQEHPLDNGGNHGFAEVIRKLLQAKRSSDGKQCCGIAITSKYLRSYLCPVSDQKDAKEPGDQCAEQDSENDEEDEFHIEKNRRRLCYSLPLKGFISM